MIYEVVLGYVIITKDLNLGISDKMNNVFMDGYIINISVISSIYSPTFSIFLYRWIAFHSIYVTFLLLIFQLKKIYIDQIF